MRLLLVGTLAAIAITLIASNNYRTQQEREVQQKRTNVQRLFEKELPQVEERWQADAEQMKARIEFSRILEQTDEQRWPKFNAFLNAQSEFTHFSSLLIMRGADQVVFSYGHEAHNIQANQVQLSSSWHYAEEAHELYRIYRLPIWLGLEGQGTLLLLKSVNNAALNAIAAPETHLNLYFQDQVLATSNGDSPKLIHPGIKEVSTSTGLLIQTDINWPGSGAQPVLIVQQDFHVAYPLQEFLLRPLLAVLMITSLIWLGLGRWLTRTVARVEKLEMATNDYAQLGIKSRAGEYFQAARGQPDEISELSVAMETLMHEVENRNHEQKAYLDTLSMLEEAVLEMDSEGLIQRASPGWDKLSRTEGSIGKQLYSYIHMADREALQAQCNILLVGEKSYASLRLRLDTMSGVHIPWMECRLVAFRDESGNVAGVRGVMRDITQTYMHEKQITHMALHDALTGLPNRVLLEDRFKVSLRQASRTMQKVGVCFIDIDHFKNVNDTLGHKAGDKLLLFFAAQLSQHLREGDTVARWGGDEFVVLLPDMDSEQQIREAVRKIVESMQASLQQEDAELVMTYSMGVALYPDDGDDIETLFSQADRAMFFAKAQGRNQACFFRDMSGKGMGKKDLYIQNRLANVINTQQIEAWFQPVISSGSRQCVGVEVLARWHDEEYGQISPSTFIPMAENLGMIHELGQQILLASLIAAQRWKKIGLKLNLAINVSGRQLFTPYFTERLLEEVARHEIDPGQIILEITESVAMLDVANAAERLLEIRNAGFKIALDDFGTGYSSLSQLHEMHVDELKIDISFVRRLSESSGLSMTQAIINLAHALKMETVAEGVETAEAANKLIELGADNLQGYYFAKPMPAEQFEQWLQQYKP